MQEYRRPGTQQQAAKQQQTYSKPAAAAAKAAATPASAGKKKAEWLLKVGQGVGNKPITITGLFKNEGKNGNVYFSGNLREDITIPAGTKMFVMENNYVEPGKAD